jgi:hypothetical protein
MSNKKKLTDLISEASALADETFANKQWVEWFNNGIDSLGEVLSLEKVSTISATSNYFAIPTDLRSIINVDSPTYLNVPQLTYQNNEDIGYKVVGNKIYLQGIDLAPIVLYYYRRPAYFSTAADVDVDLPDSYTSALIYWACAQAMIQEDEGDRYKIFMERFMDAKNMIFKMSKGRKASSVGSWKVVR